MQSPLQKPNSVLCLKVVPKRLQWILSFQHPFIIKIFLTFHDFPNHMFKTQVLLKQLYKQTLYLPQKVSLSLFLRCTHLIFRLKKDPYTYTSSTWFSATWRLQVIGHDSQQKFCSNRTAGHCFVLSHILTMLISKVFLYFAQTLSETKRNSVPLTQAVNTRITFF